jgi:hypothetical protein
MKAYSLVLALAVIATGACIGTAGSDDASDTGEATDAPSSAKVEDYRAQMELLTNFQEQLLDETDRNGVHITLYENAPGRVAVMQDAPIGVDPFFAKDEVESWDAEYLYLRLHPEVVHVPDAVARVALHAQMLRNRRMIFPPGEESAPRGIGAPANPAPSESGQHLLYDFAADDAAWFKATFCNIGSRGQKSVDDHGGPGGYDTFCWTNVGGVGYIKRGNQYDSHISIASASSTDTVAWKIYSVWDCGFLWYVECDGTKHDYTVQPRHWMSWTNDSGFYSSGNGPWYDMGGYYGARSQSGMND